MVHKQILVPERVRRLPNSLRGSASQRAGLNCQLQSTSAPESSRHPNIHALFLERRPQRPPFRCAPSQ